MAALLCLHGLATRASSSASTASWIHRKGVLPVGGAILALSALSALRRPSAVGPLLWLFGAGVVLVLGLGVAALADPRLYRPFPSQGARLVDDVVAALVFYALLLSRALRTFRPLDGEQT